MLKSVLLAAAGIVLSQFTAGAQTATGILQGLVVDSSDAAIPGAKVTIENQRTGVKQVLITNSEGHFVQPYLIPSEYRVLVEKPGFQQYVTSGVSLNVQQTVALEIPLKVGEISTTVEVSAAAAQLSTESSSVSTVISSKAVLDLPLNGRGVYGLATLSPGVIPGGGSTPWLSGGRNASSEITIDGTSVIVPENNVSILDTGYQPIVDSVEEFSVITNSLAAEYGRTGGGVINVATRSGTNQLHGSAFDYLRNSALDANSWSNNRNGAKRTPFHRNQFGGTIGGPVLIPGLYDGRNRTFFFFSEQSERRTSASNANPTVPIDAWRNGDFSGLKNGNGQPITIFDPTNLVCSPNCVRAPFDGNRIPTNRFDKVALNLLKYWPSPNAVPTNQYTFQNNFFSSGASISNADQFDSRLDHSINDSWRLWARGSYFNNPQVPFNGFGTLGTSSGDGPNWSTNYNVALNSVYTISPSTILNVNYGLARKVYHRFPFSNGISLTDLGFPSAVQAEAAQQNLEFPNISMGGNTSITGLGQATFTTLKIQSYGHEIRTDLTKVLTKHTVKFGGEFRKLFMNFTQHGQPSGQYNFGTNWTQQVPGAAASVTQGNGFASLLLGLANNGSQISHTFSIATASAYWGMYVQDDYKLARNFTLNLGLRWDVDVPRTERYNRLSYFDITAPSPIAGKVPGLQQPLVGAMKFVTPDHRHQVPTDLNNWGPRIGFAYNFASKTVFRGAYGIMYSPSVLQASGTSGSSGTEGFDSTTGMNATFDNYRTIATTLSNPFPNGFNLPVGAGGGAATNLGLGVGQSYFNDWVNPIVQEWSANIQRDLGAGFVVEFGYLGNKGNHLIDGESGTAYDQLPASYGALGSQLTQTVANPFYGVITNPTSPLYQPTVLYSQLLRPYPQYNGLSSFRKPGANSIYHAFTLRTEKRYSNGLNFLLSYTAGKLMDDASQTVTFLGAAGSKQDAYNRSAERSISAQDVSQRLVISSNYDLPFGRHRKFLSAMPSALEYLLGGWQVNGIATFQTSVPLQITQGNNTNLYSVGQRPNNNGTSAKKDGPIDQRLTSYFDQSVFSQAPSFVFGNTSRTSPDLRGPGTRAFDGSLFKNFRFHERFAAQFRAEAFNLFNHPTWNNPGANVTSPGSFGVITSASGNRNVQLALKLNF